jgi:phage I-like protein
VSKQEIVMLSGRERDAHSCVYLVELSSSEDNEWIQLLPLGEFVTNDSRKLKLKLTREAAQQIIDKFDSTNTDLVIDYEHLPHFDPKPENMKAAGWIKALELREDGLYARVEWTPAALAAVKNKEFRYISPTLIASKSGVIEQLLDAAVTNKPAIDGMKPLSLAADNNKEESMEEILKALGLPTDATVEQALAKIAELGAGSESDTESLSAVRKELGLKDEDDVQVMLSSITNLKKTDGKVPAGVLTVLKLSADASMDTVLGTIKGLQNGAETVATLSQKVQALESENHEKKCIEAVDDAIAKGKITPAQREACLKQAQENLESFSAFIKASPVVHDLGSRGAADVKNDDVVTLSAVDKSMMAQMGVSEDDYKKYGRM